MTVSYSPTVATVHYGALIRILLRWRGSVYKAVWPVFLAFTCAYGITAITYYNIPSNTVQGLYIKKQFVKVCAYFRHLSNALPVSFVLGFFVNMVVKRWWEQFLNLPTPDYTCLLLSAYLKKPSKLKAERDDGEARALMFKRTIGRYLNLSYVLCFSSIVSSLGRRFNSLDDCVLCGLMTRQEKEIYLRFSQGNNYFVIPLAWAIGLIARAQREGMIDHDVQLNALVGEVVAYWRRLHTLVLYDSVNVPLVYNQVVTLVVYLYLGSLVLSRQFENPEDILNACKNSPNVTITQNSSFTAQPLTPSCSLDIMPNIPVFAVVALVCYAGWLRVAEAHVFPFGTDDDDFDVLSLLDRNSIMSHWYVNIQVDNTKLLQSSLQMDSHLFEEKSNHLEPRPSNYATECLMRTGVFDAEGQELPAELNDRVPSLAPRESDERIPELPCPPELRRRESRFFLAGSAARIYGDECIGLRGSANTSTVSSRKDWQRGRLGSVGTFVRRLGSRLSQSYSRPIIVPSTRMVNDVELDSWINSSPVSNVEARASIDSSIPE
ncbi:unnamed protein product [Calicophoron daubneyi]|uniref:Bestrophin homolog n=1 Tax=Calicophoron daubneyi TaxID=300641 RepID=A0AAV2TII1_CALDB